MWDRAGRKISKRLDSPEDRPICGASFVNCGYPPSCLCRHEPWPDAFLTVTPRRRSTRAFCAVTASPSVDRQASIRCKAMILHTRTIQTPIRSGRTVSIFPFVSTPAWRKRHPVCSQLSDMRSTALPSILPSVPTELMTRWRAICKIRAALCRTRPRFYIDVRCPRAFRTSGKETPWSAKHLTASVSSPASFP